MDDPGSWVNADDDLARHHRERAENGFSFFDWINLHCHFSWVIVNSLKMMIERGAGTPACYSEEEWHGILREIIDGFEAIEELDDYTNSPEPPPEVEAARANAMSVDEYGIWFYKAAHAGPAEDAWRAEVAEWEASRRAKFDRAIELFRDNYLSFWD